VNKARLLSEADGMRERRDRTARMKSLVLSVVNYAKQAATAVREARAYGEQRVLHMRKYRFDVIGPRERIMFTGAAALLHMSL